MRKQFIRIAAFAVLTLLLGGCAGSQPGAAEDSQQADSPQDSAVSQEEQVAKSHENLSPADYSDRLLTVDDLQGDFTIDEEHGFGDTLNQDTSVFSEPEPATEPTIASCVSDAPSKIEDDLERVTAARVMSDSGESDMRMVMNSLSRPDADPHQLVDAMKSALEECSNMEPQDSMYGDPVESIDIYAPQGANGSGICATTFSGADSPTVVMDSCYFAWAGEFMMVMHGAGKAGASFDVDQAAVEGIKSQMTEDVLPIALTRTGFAA